MVTSKCKDCNWCILTEDGKEIRRLVYCNECVHYNSNNKKDNFKKK